MAANAAKTPINGAFLAAALAALVFLALHLIVGEQRYHLPALQSGMNAEQQALYTVLWHGVSLVILINTLALALAAWRPDWRGAALFALVQFAAWSLLDLFIGIARLGAPWPLIQWLIMLPILILGIWGLRR